MNVGVFVLFFNAFLTTLLSSIIVIWILRRSYLPVLERIERGEPIEPHVPAGRQSVETPDEMRS